MAEYCSKCTPFKNKYDIDLFKIALKLKKGFRALQRDSGITWVLNVIVSDDNIGFSSFHLSLQEIAG